MSYNEMDGQLLKRVFTVSATAYFEKNVEFINSLNVFPVPDGDTGTNMNLTIQAGLKAIAKSEEKNLGEIVKVLSRGMLLGARGNSGVILSQIWRGMSQAFDGHKTATTRKFAEALQSGADVAYRSVMKPVEGTILTVIRETAEQAIAIAIEENDFTKFLNRVVKAAKVSLDGTPELLPVLKEVGVVDSGGQGLVTLLEGMLFELQGLAPSEMKAHEAVVLDNKTFEFDDEHGEDEFGFCTEFIIRLDNPELFDKETVGNELQAIGTSLVLVNDEDILKVHVHTLTPLSVFEKYGNLGEFIWIKAENMQNQVDDRKNVDELLDVEITTEKPATKVDIALISILSGQGIAAAFKDLGVHKIVDGGQTSNPSTQDILNAIESIDANSYIILPNNSNIILAAEQVKSLTDKKVEIVPSKTIPQGLAATIAFNSMASVDDNVAEMTHALGNVKSGEVTTAVRDTALNGVDIKEGSYISICEKEIVASEATLALATKKLIDRMIDDESEIITLIEGENVDPEIKQAVTMYIERTYPDLEVDYIDGQQSVYFYLVSVE